MATHITNALAIAALDSIVDACDVGSANAAAEVWIYSGTPPADADAALSGNTLLAELVMSNPAFGAAADDTPGAIATASSITDDSSANANGTATFFRIVNRDEAVVLQGTVGTSSADLIVATTTFVAGQPVQISSLTVSLPESSS